MHPRLVVGDLAVSAYYAAIAAGLVLGWAVLRREARREGFRVRDVFDLVLIAMPTTLVFARLLVLLDDPATYVRDPSLVLSPTQGWASYGALTGVLVGVLGGAWWKGMDAWRVADVFAPMLLFTQAIGRLGCLAAGCCHGRPADWPLGVEVPWSVRYYLPGVTAPSLVAVPLHPSPVYESLLTLFLFVGISRRRDRQGYAGQALATLLVGYGVGRFVLELFRGDVQRGTIAGGALSVGQGVCVLLVLTGLVIHRRRSACSPS